MIIGIRDLSVQYHNTQKTALKNISLEVDEGEHVALLGPSGCGKTTLLCIIAGLLTKKDAAISGEIKTIPRTKKLVIRMVFQDATLLPWRTVEENIAYGLEAIGMRKDKRVRIVGDMLALTRLSDCKNYLPEQISGGMRQRVNFARALACHPDLLLLDEPFSGLDESTKKTIRQEFKDILVQKNITSIFVTHSLEEAKAMADTIVTLDGSPAIIAKIQKKSPQAGDFENSDSA